MASINANAGTGDPGAAEISDRPRKLIYPLITKLPNRTQAIFAELRGSNEACALGITVRASAPVLAVCRKLVNAGHDPATPLHAYRGDTLSLCIRSIGEAARLEINSGGTNFVRHRAVRAARLVRKNSQTPVTNTPCHVNAPCHLGAVFGEAAP